MRKAATSINPTQNEWAAGKTVREQTKSNLSSTMPRTTSKKQKLAEWLVEYETRECSSLETKEKAICNVFEKLRSQLVVLMGVVGFSALFSRALFLVQKKGPWLHSAIVTSLGTLEGLENQERPIDFEEMREGAVVLLSQLLELLTGFVGECLTMSLLYEVWPALTQVYGALENGNENTQPTNYG